MPAAPTPVVTMRTSASSLPTTRSAFSSAASTTIAVPCWSSWKTGMSSAPLSLRSISKQRGDAMSSRLMPPKPGAIAVTAVTISSTSVVARQMGQASTSANSLNSAALPSITGSAASGPMSPSPSTAVPSVTTATAFCFEVRVQTADGSAAIAVEIRATPGVYAIERSSLVLSGTFERTAILPPRCRRNVRSETRSTSTPSRPRTASVIRSRCSAPVASTVTSRTFTPGSTRTMSIAPSSPPASPIACASRANEPGLSERCTRNVALNDGERWPALMSGRPLPARGSRPRARRSPPRGGPGRSARPRRAGRSGGAPAPRRARGGAPRA